MPIPPHAPSAATPNPAALRVVLAGLVALSSVATGCTVRSFATKKLADTFAATGSSYASDDDPELIREAAPFGLKTMEQLADEQPQHVGLMTALASGYVEYGFAFVQQDADRMETVDMKHAGWLRERARRLYLRARGYGLRGLEVGHPGFTAAFREPGPKTDGARKQVLATMTKADVPLLYWTAAAWTLAIVDGKDDMRLVGSLPLAELIMNCAYALDPDWDHGSLEEFYVSYDGARSEAEGGGPERARQHLQRALRLSQNKKVSALVSFAETVLVDQQDKTGFVQMLQQVLDFDADKYPEYRLANVIAQRRARWLLTRTDDLFAN